EPFNGFERRRVDAHLLHLGDEIERIPAVLALGKAVPDVLADADAELRRIAALVDRARAVQAVAGAFELVEQAIVPEDLLHGDGRLDGFEVNERVFRHTYLLWFWLICAVQGLNRLHWPGYLPANEIR